MARVEVGFGRRRIDDGFEDGIWRHDPLEVCAVWFGGPALDGPVLMLMLDLCFLSRAKAAALREAVGRPLGLPADRVVTHCTHVHTAPWSGGVAGRDLAGLMARCVEAGRQARQRAAPAWLMLASGDAGPDFAIRRRQAAFQGQAALTVFMGGVLRPEGAIDYEPFNRARLTVLLGRPPARDELPAPHLYDQPIERRWRVMRFINDAGEPLGAIVLAAAHPAAGGHTTRRGWSADFPGVVRRRLHSAWGCEVAYLNGPSGDIITAETGDWPLDQLARAAFDPRQVGVPWIPQLDADACWRQVERLGALLADRIHEGASIAGCDRAVALDDASFHRDPVQLRLRDDGWGPPALTPERWGPDRARRPAVEVKRLADAWQTYAIREPMLAWYDIPGAEVRGRRLGVDLPTLRVGPLILAGLPGESFDATAHEASAWTDRAGLTLAAWTHADGDVGYLPTEEAFALGDYEPCTSLIAPGQAEHLAAAFTQAVARVC